MEKDHIVVYKYSWDKEYDIDYVLDGEGSIAQLVTKDQADKIIQNIMSGHEPGQSGWAVAIKVK